MTETISKRNPTSAGADAPNSLPGQPTSLTTPCRFLTKQQTLNLLGCSATTLFVLTHKAGFPKARVLYANAASTSGRSYYLAEEVDAWMKGRPVRVLKVGKTDRGQA